MQPPHDGRMMPTTKTVKALLLTLLLAGCQGSVNSDVSHYVAGLGLAQNDGPRALLLQDGDKRLELEAPASGYWSGIEMFGADAGLSYSEVRPLADGNFVISGKSVIRMHLLGQDKELIYDSREVVGPNLRLVSFSHKTNSDGYEQLNEGHVSGNKLHLTVTNAAGSHQESIPLEEPLFAYSASGLYAALHGLQAGAEHRYMVYENESRQPKELWQKVRGQEKSPVDDRTAWRLESTLQGIKSHSWMDLNLQPIMETALNGSIVATVMSREQAIDALAKASINKSENLIQFSMVPTAPLPQPYQLQKLDISFSGLPDSFTFPEKDGRQSCQRKGSSEAARCVIEAAPSHSGPAPVAEDTAATVIINSEHPRIQTLAQEIASKQRSASAKIDDLVSWVSANIKSEAVDAFTALDVLESRRGECQGQSFLYTSLARAVGIPTKVVNGLVYSEEHGGFLYHTWAESWDGKGWRSVDPTFFQHTADATHIKLTVGEEADDIVPLVNLIGHISAEVTAYN